MKKNFLTFKSLVTLVLSFFLLTLTQVQQAWAGKRHRGTHAGSSYHGGKRSHRSPASRSKRVVKKGKKKPAKHRKHR